MTLHEDVCGACVNKSPRIEELEAKLAEFEILLQMDADGRVPFYFNLARVAHKEIRRLKENNQTFADLAVKNPIDEAFDYTSDLENALREIIEIQPLDVFGPMSDRMRRIAREALK